MVVRTAKEYSYFPLPVKEALRTERMNETLAQCQYQEYGPCQKIYLNQKLKHPREAPAMGRVSVMPPKIYQSFKSSFPRF